MKKTQNDETTVSRRANPGRRAEDQKRLPDFRDLVDNSLQGILVHRNFRPLYANAAFAKLYGYRTPEEIMALHLIRPLVPPEMWAHVEEEYDELVRGTLKKPPIARTRGVRKDGSDIWLSITERVVDWHGTPAVQWTVFDISEQVGMEQELLEKEQRLRAMLETLPVPVYIAREHDGQLLFVNRKTCLLFQQSAGPLLHSKSRDFYVEPEERENLRKMLDAVPDIREVEVRMRTARGREFTAELAVIRINYGGETAVLVSLNDISQRKKMEEELFHQASTDALTGISNRRYFLMQAEQEMRRTRRFDRRLSMMMIDLDHFKPINDQMGHATGDAVLEGVVRVGLESLRESDVMGRLGGEEFAVLLPETGIEAATEVAGRFCQHIAEHPVVTIKGAVRCTVSIGVAEMAQQDGSIDDLLRRADEALYRAKENGRGRVETAE